MTIYNNLVFRTNLEATWAAFFDLVGWKWDVNPVPIHDWKPDFRVTFPCNHSECNGSHTILVAVLPVSDITLVKGHPALNHQWSVENQGGETVADAGAVFGSHPSVTYWVMSHGAGGGAENAENWVGNRNISQTWKNAEALTVIHPYLSADEIAIVKQHREDKAKARTLREF